MHTVRRMSLLSLFCLSCTLAGGVTAEESSTALKTTELHLASPMVARPLASVPQQRAQALRTAAPTQADQGQWLRISDDGETDTAQQQQRPQRWVF
ncbi:hypothetical protein [Aquipseudomonas ullengensis]|uniref:Uncharacterized protein n=1 Tax=Aquipseudomonas ullengensis TaxID=2759166 RepID=A0A7W4LJL1_9GAMM|nr:hypothetical protein [Pseudomonas ullengensis]MBB2494379.1 hypothetical protein [Pseudomonas ullengensis]